jgi:hypothetical protein
MTVAVNHEESTAAGNDADDDTLQQRAEVVSFGWLLLARLLGRASARVSISLSAFSRSNWSGRA